MEAQPVKIIDQEKPVTVEIQETEKEKRLVNKSDDQTLAPTTTHQEDITTSGQRKINLIWEITQAMIAISITLSIIYTAVMAIGNETLTNAFFLIVGFYFSRTNHQAIGGVGKQPTQKYEGR